MVLCDFKVLYSKVPGAAAFCVALALFFSGHSLHASEQADDVLASVNGAPIRASDIGLTPNSTFTDQQLRAAVEAAVREEVLVAEALRAGLADDADVKREVEKFRRSVLAKALLARSGGGGAPVLESEVNQFITENPDLFSGRRIYRLTDFAVFIKSAAEQQALLAALDAYDRRVSSQRRNSDLLTEWLQTRGLVFQRSSSFQSSEQINSRYLSVIKDLENVGFTPLLEDEGKLVRIFFAHGSFPEPINPAQVRPNLRMGLATIARGQASDSFINSLVAKADISVSNRAIFDFSQSVVSRSEEIAIIGKRELAYAGWILFCSILSIFLTLRVFSLSRLRQRFSAQEPSALLASLGPLAVVMLFIILISSIALALPGTIAAGAGLPANVFASPDIRIVAAVVGGALGGVFVAAVCFLLSHFQRGLILMALLYAALICAHALAVASVFVRL